MEKEEQEQIVKDFMSGLQPLKDVDREEWDHDYHVANCKIHFARWGWRHEILKDEGTWHIEGHKDIIDPDNSIPHCYVKYSTRDKILRLYKYISGTSDDQELHQVGCSRSKDIVEITDALLSNAVPQTQVNGT